MKKFKAILFDFDGTLADSMEDNYSAWKKSFHDLGIEISKEDYFTLEGMNLAAVARTIAREYNASINIPSAVKSKNKYYLRQHSFKLYDGAPELVDKLKEKRRLIAIVSASPKEKLEKTVPAEFLAKFDAVISGSDTRKGKPSPEPYLAAMRKLRVSSEKCVVVENAPLGIISAKAAGAYCIALTTTLAREYLKEADEVLDNYEELARLLLP